MSVRELRDMVYAALYPAHLGSYATLAGPKPALSVVPPQLRNDRAVSGLEVIVIASPEYKLMSMLNNATALERIWTIRLVQWDKTKVLSGAIEALIQAIPRIQVSITAATDISEEQAAILVPEPTKRIRVKQHA